MGDGKNILIDSGVPTNVQPPPGVQAPIHGKEAVRASTRKLLDLVEREGISLVVFGHDGEQWQTLIKLPEAYC
jgi:hypothetical protein